MLLFFSAIVFLLVIYWVSEGHSFLIFALFIFSYQLQYAWIPFDYSSLVLTIFCIFFPSC